MDISDLRKQIDDIVKAVRGAVTMPVAVMVGSDCYAAAGALRYTAQAGHRGFAK